MCAGPWRQGPDPKGLILLLLLLKFLGEPYWLDHGSLEQAGFVGGVWSGSFSELGYWAAWSCVISLSFCFLSYLMFQNQSPCSSCEFPEEMRDWLLNLLVPFISVHPPSLWCMGWLLRSSQRALKGSTAKQSGRQGEQKFGISWIKPQGILWLVCCEEENRTRPLNLYIFFGSGAIVHNRKSGTNDTHHHGHHLFRWDLIPLYFFYFLCLCCKQSTRPLPGIDKYIKWVPLCSRVSVKCWLWVWPCIKSRVILECCCALMQ